MAVLAAAALLDELMGRNRNIDPNEKGRELNWEDAEFCPHDLFVNTRADLGACTKVHDEEVRKMFESAKGHKKIHYQEEFVRFCTSMVNEVDRKIVKGKQRLALSGKNETASNLSPAQTQKNTEQITLLNERINGLVEEAEQAGNDGNVEQAQGLMKLCDQLKEERDNLKKLNDNSHWSATAELAAAQEKQMEVCEVCGAFLIVGDAQQRIDDHLMGKQHVGYARLKLAIDEIQALVESSRDERRGARGGGLGSAPTIDDRRERQRNERHRRGDNYRERSEHKIDKDKERPERERKEKDRGGDRNNREGRDTVERDRNNRRDGHRDSRGGNNKDRERGGGGGGGERRHRSDRDFGRERDRGERDRNQQQQQQVQPARHQQPHRR